MKAGSSPTARPKRSAKTATWPSICSGPTSDHAGSEEHPRLAWAGAHPARGLVERSQPRSGLPGRAQRRRQDHDHGKHHGLCAGQVRQILFHGEEVTSLPVHSRARRGMGYAPEGCEIFPQLTVAENMMISRWMSAKARRRLEALADGDVEEREIGRAHV